MISKINHFFVALLVMLGAATAANATGPTGPDFTTMTSEITFESVSTAVLSVGALAIGLTLTVLGIRKIMQMARSA